MQQAVSPGGTAKSDAKKARKERLQSLSLASANSTAAPTANAPANAVPAAASAGSQQAQPPSSKRARKGDATQPPSRTQKQQQQPPASQPYKLTPPIASHGVQGPDSGAAKSAQNREAQKPGGNQGVSAQAWGAGNSDARAGDPPYSPLDASIVSGPLARMLQLPTTRQTATDKGRKRDQGSLGTDAVAAAGSDLDSLIEVLLRTNPALVGSADARASAGLRVQDKSILLNNPPGAHAKPVTTRQPPGYSKQLIKKRRSPAPRILKQGDIRHAQLVPLHQLWLQYVHSQLGNVLPPPSHSQPRPHHQQQQQHKQRKQQQQQPDRATHGGHLPSTHMGLPNERQLSAAQAALARIQLAHCDLHGSVLKVIQSPNPQLTGCHGIVAQVTARVVCLVDRQDKLHVVPKQGAWFACDLTAVGLPSAAVFEGESIQIGATDVAGQTRGRGSRTAVRSLKPR